MRRRDVVAAATAAAASERARGILASMSPADGNESGMGVAANTLVRRREYRMLGAGGSK
jgi:hypothetical protein